ncbi:MAG: GIY-YIG nuclease family protein [Candidatus Omnitrophica bacterium]|nr:GIY-YIG nuclease family protein [Candidatus Omnitrophota bacterium]
MLQTADGKYYVGQTDNLELRIAQHQMGEIPGFTSRRLPVKLVFSEEFPSRDEAFVMERRIKGWSRGKKEALVAGDWQRISQMASRRRS